MKRLLVLLVTSLAALALAGAAGASHDTVEVVSFGPTGGNAALSAEYKFVSQDGSRVVFQTTEQLVAADTDTRVDVYERASGITNLVSIGSTGGNGGFNATFTGASDDASRVFFHTSEKLESGDTDSQNDVYQRAGGGTSLLSTGPTGGNGAIGAFFDGNSANGIRVWFHSAEQLASGDTDTSTDVYERIGGLTERVSTGTTGGNGAFGAFFDGASSDGTRVFFSTDEALVATDTDAFFDVYERSGGATTKLSTGPTGGNGATDAFFDGSSADGTRVFLSTDEALTVDDTDSNYDVYQRSGATTTRLSTGGAGGNGGLDTLWVGSSADGTRVFLETDEVLAAGDSDSLVDVYERTGSTTTRLSTGPAGGNGAFDAQFAGASADGLRVFFETEEILRAEDVDSFFDVYERTGTTTTLVSIGPTGGNGNFEADFDAASASGDRVFFHTDESLTSFDTDSVRDVYERNGSDVSRASGGLIGGNGAFTASFAGISADGTKLVFTSFEKLVMTDTDSSQDIYVASISPDYPRPGGATPFRVPLVPAYSQCSSPNAVHIAPLNGQSCTPPSQQSTLLTMSTIGRGTGSAALRTIVGDSGTPADEADISISLSAGDVLRRSDGLDYTGQVALEVSLRMTDRANGTSGTTPATVADTTFAVPVSCVATPGPAGSNCNVNVTADALVPGYVKEGKRSILSIMRLTVLDAGADGSLTPPSGACPPTCGSGDEAIFLDQGVFLP